MKIDGLTSIDLSTVPLPHGTAVKTTASRIVPGTDHVVKQGAVGRVVAAEGDRVRVRVVGMGEVDYPRSEVIPRKRGQIQFALRRSQTEKALRPCAILEATVGSRAWGLANESSDVDLRGVFLFPFTWTTGIGSPPEVIVSADGSETYWELERTIQQGLRADPNTLEMLFVPEVKTLNAIGEELLARREAFVSQKIYGSFGRYALAQAKKLGQSVRMAEHRALILDWLRERPEMSLDLVATRLASEALDPDDPSAVHRSRQYLKQLYRSMHDQGLLEAASFDSLKTFARERSAQLDIPRELRPKNAYNLLRIVSCAVHWLATGSPLIEVTGELQERLLAIKSGEVPLRTSLRWTEQTATKLDEARSRTPLPPDPDMESVDTLLRRAREWAAQQWLEGEHNIWGADAPSFPKIVESEESTRDE